MLEADLTICQVPAQQLGVSPPAWTNGGASAAGQRDLVGNRDATQLGRLRPGHDEHAVLDVVDASAAQLAPAQAEADLEAGREAQRVRQRADGRDLGLAQSLGRLLLDSRQ